MNFIAKEVKPEPDNLARREQDARPARSVSKLAIRVGVEALGK